MPLTSDDGPRDAVGRRPVADVLSFCQGSDVLFTVGGGDTGVTGPARLVGNGDPHDITRPENVRQPTATDILESILARDDAPVSATTTAHEHTSPTLRLGAATARYVDSLHVAAEHHLGATAVAALEAGADRFVPGIADDRAAVLDWRLHDPGTDGTGPLPWLPGIPAKLREEPPWGPYLNARSDLVTTLADEVRRQTTSRPNTPNWWAPGRLLSAPDLLADLAVWRAANTIPDSDHRPTGPTQPAKAHARWQHELDARVGSSGLATLADWTNLIHKLVPAARRDDYTPQLAGHLAELSGTGIDAHTLLHTATGSPLPDDHAASALWWRIQRHLPDPGDLSAAAPVEWPTAEDTAFRDHDVGADEPGEPRRNSDYERRMTPVRHDQPRGPGMTR